ncbi:hypothetical protein EES39_11455 [Streptomyces sp. ADI92-24]|uniref:hypothetical protein n=1 Tax=unclassified Streptomyces TaxID=2593676 RepID=UPI000F54ECB7|nr:MULTISPECIES: hypothetical protein [unclassified Streptomyces]MCX4771299.1 hypothetical protein [Streptomyces sp. NBC_01285]RPK47759.1 hypothetical protein EES39_11455 [Streptomyces sp. ADI92-24]
MASGSADAGSSERVGGGEDHHADIFGTIGKHLRPGGPIGVCVGTFRDSSGKVTPLAFDIGHALSEVLEFEGEIYFEWSTPSESLTGDHCLLFSAAGC